MGGAESPSLSNFSGEYQSEVVEDVVLGLVDDVSIEDRLLFELVEEQPVLLL